MRQSFRLRVAIPRFPPPSRLQFAICNLQLALCLASPLRAQNWNSPSALELASRAVSRRSSQIAASSLASYSAKATGYLTFLGQVGDTAIFGPKVIKQTQLAVDVYWRAPASSKQVVRGMRDTLLTPADIDYYSDRFGIVQSNFPDRIRMGDGLDVADVMHPLSPAGLGAYDFAIVDSTNIRTSTERIDVYQLMYRPRDPRQPRAIGSAYLDVRTADIVQLDLTFTRSAILDKRIEYLSVSLENALVEGRAWLPRRQAIEVVRTGTFLSMEARGIIRGRWDVCCYDVEFVAPAGTFLGAPISFAPPDQLRKFPFKGGILDSLPPGVAVVRQEDLERVQRQAEDIVKLQFRERAQKASINIPHISDVVRVTRTEGLAVGVAGKLHPTTLLDFDARTRYGFSDREWKGEAGVRLNLGRDRALRLYALRDYVEARDVPEVSGVRNSIAAQEFGSDYTDPYDVRAAGVQLWLGRWARARWRIDAAAEEHAPLSVVTAPENGAYESTIPARSVKGTRVSVHADGAALSLAGGTMRINSELRLVNYDARGARLAVDAEYERPAGSGTLQWRTVAAALSGGALPPQLFVYLGGPVTAPGYRFDEFAARRGVSQHLEWRTEMPFFAIPLGRFGRTPPRATIAPFVHAVWVDDPASMRLFPPTIGGSTSPALVRGDRQGWYPSVGIGFEPLLGIFRFDFAHGLRDGRWTFSADLSRAWWAIL